MTTLKTLADVTEADRATIGGKAYNCARLRQAGFPVPDGVIVPTDMSERDIQALAADPWFDAQPAGALYAVRSSGIDEDGVGHSFAGIHDTHLNVSRGELVEAVLVCRRSAQSDQAVAYRQTRRLDGGGLIGILVQRMVPAAMSGVAFTVNPVTGANELVVNAAPGLGEALVSGQVDPDEIVLRKNDHAVVSSRLGAANLKPVLSPAQIFELAPILLRIEVHYNAPQDIEFCHDGRQFWIVQSRPITTKQSSAPGTSGTLGPLAPHIDIEWSRANLAEVLPEQMSPQALYSFEEMLNAAQRQFMGKLLAPDSERGPMFKVFYGRMYMNLSQMRRVCRLAGAPAADMLRSLGHSEQIQPEDEVAAGRSLKEVLPLLPDVVRLGWMDLLAEKLFAKHERDTQMMVDRLTIRRPESMSDRELWDVYQWWITIVPESVQVVFVMSNVLFRETLIKRACRRVGYPYEKLVYPQLAAGQRSVSSQQAIDLVGLAATARRDAQVTRYLIENDGAFADIHSALAGSAFLKAFDRFLETYGHRGHYESDWALPRLHENPAPALFAIREQLKGAPQDTRALAERQEADAARAWREFDAKLTWWQRLTLLPMLRSLLRRLKKQYVWREKVRSNLTRILRLCREYHLVMANRFVERGWLARRDDYFLLLIEEVGEAVADPSKGSGLRTIVERRSAQRAAERELHLPLHAFESELPRLMRQTEVPTVTNGSLSGLCVSPGSVEGEVVVMQDPSEFASMKRGAILVTRATDPSWTPLFTLASGVIVEVGGVLSHASTIAREYGLPALANVKHATSILKNGDRVRLDASGGRVTLVS